MAMTVNETKAVEESDRRKVFGLAANDASGILSPFTFSRRAAMGTMDGIINTVSANHNVVPLFHLLKNRGKMIMLGIPEHPLELPAFTLIWGGKILAGSTIGGLKETQEMIDFAAEHNITADIELIKADYVNEAMERLARADVKYRFVIDIGNTLSAN